MNKSFNELTIDNDARLDFKDGRFRLADPSAEELRVLRVSPYWKRKALYFETGNLRSAAAFRSYATPEAERIIKRAFQEKYRTYSWLPPIWNLDEHQERGVLWVLSRKRSYLAHAPGAGKTAEAIVAAVLAGEKDPKGQTLFIVPPSLTLNWEREVLKFTEPAGVFPTIGIVPTSDRQAEMAWRADFIICPDSMLTKHWVYAGLLGMKKRFIAVDEASRFKDPMAQRSIAFYGGRTPAGVYPGLFQDARHVVFLDGSPMPNRPMELWVPLYALDPESIDCMDQDDFGYRYCGPRITDRGQYTFDHSSNEKELNDRMTRSFMHVVRESELSHPERRRSMVFTDRDLRSAEQKTWERAHLSGLTEFKDDAVEGELARFRRELGVKKIPWIAGYVASRLREKNESILLFAWHREVCLRLRDELRVFGPALVMGGTSASDREKAFEEFQAGRSRLIIGNIQAMGRGHNLQRADRVIFGEFSWTDELNKQCEKRASRRGSDRDFVRCEYVVSPGSIDEWVLSSVFTKEKRVERVIG